MIAVLDYGLGNIGSILNAFEKLGIKAVETSDSVIIKRSDGLVFPGDGAAGRAMENLDKKELIAPVKDFVRSGKPFLGICLGMQILLSFSEEGKTNCLNVIPGTVKKFNNGFKIPQIGWNGVKITGQLSKVKCLFKGISDQNYFYFINSYYCDPEDKNIVVGTTEYGSNFCSIFMKNNICGVQFHPEKSGKPGFQFLLNYFNN